MENSAIDWLVKKISYTTSDGVIISYHKVISNLVEQAKEIEKEYLEKLKDFDTWKEWKNRQ